MGGLGGWLVAVGVGVPSSCVALVRVQTQTGNLCVKRTSIIRPTMALLANDVVDLTGTSPFGRAERRSAKGRITFKTTVQACWRRKDSRGEVQGW